MKKDEHPLFSQLGISDLDLEHRNIPFYSDTEQLVVAQTDDDGRIHELAPKACAAWSAMRDAAAADGIELIIVSAFRSSDRQAEIIQKKIDAGQTPEQILSVSAMPGYSEHHTGRAIDLTTPGYAALEEEFEDSPAFMWLSKHASEYHFSMSYPRDNRHGYIYEPWHWLYSSPE